MQPPEMLTPGTLSQFYSTHLEGYDEMYAGEGQLLPHWQTLMEDLAELGKTGLELRQHEAQRLLRENGVIYGANEGSLVVDMSTISPDTTRYIAGT